MNIERLTAYTNAIAAIQSKSDRPGLEKISKKA